MILYYKIINITNEKYHIATLYSNLKAFVIILYVEIRLIGG